MLELLLFDKPPLDDGNLACSYPQWMTCLHKYDFLHLQIAHPHEFFAFWQALDLVRQKQWLVLHEQGRVSFSLTEQFFSLKNWKVQIPFLQNLKESGFCVDSYICTTFSQETLPLELQYALSICQLKACFIDTRIPLFRSLSQIFEQANILAQLLTLLKKSEQHFYFAFCVQEIHDSQCEQFLTWLEDIDCPLKVKFPLQNLVLLQDLEALHPHLLDVSLAYLMQNNTHKEMSYASHFTKECVAADEVQMTALSVLPHSHHNDFIPVYENGRQNGAFSASLNQKRYHTFIEETLQCKTNIAATDVNQGNLLVYNPLAIHRRIDEIVHWQAGRGEGYFSSALKPYGSYAENRENYHVQANLRPFDYKIIEAKIIKRVALDKDEFSTLSQQQKLNIELDDIKGGIRCYRTEDRAESALQTQGYWAWGMPLLAISSYDKNSTRITHGTRRVAFGKLEYSHYFHSPRGLEVEQGFFGPLGRIVVCYYFLQDSNHLPVCVVNLRTTLLEPQNDLTSFYLYLNIPCSEEKSVNERQTHNIIYDENGYSCFWPSGNEAQSILLHYYNSLFLSKKLPSDTSFKSKELVFAHYFEEDQDYFFPLNNEIELSLSFKEMQSSQDLWLERKLDFEPIMMTFVEELKLGFRAQRLNVVPEGTSSLEIEVMGNNQLRIYLHCLNVQEENYTLRVPRAKLLKVYLFKNIYERGVLIAENKRQLNLLTNKSFYLEIEYQPE